MIYVTFWVCRWSSDLQLSRLLSILDSEEKFIISDTMVATKKKPTTRKTSQKSSPKSTWSTKKTVSRSKKKKDTGVIKSTEKKELLQELKTSMKSMGRIPSLIMAPVILFVNKRYDSLPADRKKSLKWISKKLKDGSSDGLSHLKEWFGSTSKAVSRVGSKEKKKAKKAAKKPVKKVVKKSTSKVKKSAKKTVSSWKKVAKTASKKPRTTTTKKTIS